MDDKMAQLALVRGYNLARKLSLDNVNVDDLVQTVMVDCVRRGIMPTREHLLRRGIDVWRVLRKDRLIKEELLRQARLTDNNGFGQVNREDQIEQLLKGTSPRERKIIWLRFYQGKTLDEIAQVVGKSKNRVGQELSETLSRLSHLII